MNESIFYRVLRDTLENLSLLLIGGGLSHCCVGLVDFQKSYVHTAVINQTHFCKFAPTVTIRPFHWATCVVMSQPGVVALCVTNEEVNPHHTGHKFVAYEGPYSFLRPMEVRGNCARPALFRSVPPYLIFLFRETDWVCKLSASINWDYFWLSY